MLASHKLYVGFFSKEGLQLMSESEIARLRAQLEQEHAASVWALTGLASGTAQHAFITARLRRMDVYHKQLSELVGEEQATEMLCNVFDQKTP